MSTQKRPTAKNSQIFHRSWWSPAAMVALALIGIGVAAGLAFDEGLNPPWLNHLMIGVFLAMAAVALLIAPRPWRPIVTVSDEGVWIAGHLTHPIPWAAITGTVAMRNDLPDGSFSSWELWLWVRDAPSFVKRRTHHDGEAIQLPLRLVVRRQGEPAGEDVLRAIERFRPVERRTPLDELAMRQQATPRSPAGHPVASTATVGFREGPVMRILAGAFFGLLGITGASMVIGFDGTIDLGLRWVTVSVGSVILLGAIAAGYFGGLVLPKDEITVGPAGIFVRDRVKEAVPWDHIRLIELVFDRSPMGTQTGPVGWLLRVQVDEPGRWMSRRQVRHLYDDGAFALTVSGFRTTRGTGDTIADLRAAIEHYMPVIVRRP